MGKKTGKLIPCANCGKEFYLPGWRKKRSDGNYCSHECHSKSLVVPRVDRNCRQCGQLFLIRQREIDKGRGTVCSKECSLILARKAAIEWFKNTDESEHSRWQGDKVGYFGVHDWMTKHYGQPVGCEVCGSLEAGKKYYWANLSGEYKRDRNDFKRMCMSCHRKFDDAGHKAWQTFLRNKALATA